MMLPLFRICLPLWLLLAAPSVLRAGAPVFTAAVEARLPHDPKCFTQGLIVRNGFFYESCGQYGQSSLRETEAATGRVVRERKLSPEFFAEGLAELAGRLYQLTWREGRVFVSGRDDFTPQAVLPLTTEGWGISIVGDRLVVSDGTAVLRFYEPSTFKQVGSVTVTDAGREIDRLNELETVGGLIWANVWGEDRIAVIDPATGKVAAWVDCAAATRQAGPAGRADPDNVLNGIAYDPATGRIYITGKRWPYVFAVGAPGVPGTGETRGLPKVQP